MADPVLAHGTFPPAAVVGSMLYVSASALDPATSMRLAGIDSVTDETNALFDRLEAVLNSVGAGVEHIVKTTCFVSVESDRHEFMSAYSARLAPGSLPARCTFVVGLEVDLRVQIEAVVCIPHVESRR